MIIFILDYSYFVAWLSQNIRTTALDRSKQWQIATIHPPLRPPACRVRIYLSSISFEYLWVNIGWCILICISHYSDSVLWWSQNSIKMSLPSKIWKTTTMFFSCLVQYGYCFHMETFLFFFNEYWLRYAHFYFILRIFSVLMILK